MWVVKKESALNPFVANQMFDSVVSLSLRLLMANCLCVSMSLGFFLFFIHLFSRDQTKPSQN